MTAIPHHIDREYAGRVYQFPIVRMRRDRPRRRAWPLTLAVLVAACLLGTGAGMCGSAPEKQQDADPVKSYIRQHEPAPSKQDAPSDFREENGHPTPNPKG